MPARPDRAPGVRALGLGHAEQLKSPGLKVHHPERGGEVKQRRDGRRLDDFHIGDANGFGHDERDRAHDRRHDLATHAGCRFNAAREIGAITETLHQRNRKLAGGHDIGDARPVDRPHQAGGRRPQPSPGRPRVADRAQCEIGEELDHAGLLEKGPEQDEQEDVRRRDVDRNAVDALGTEGHLVDHLVEAEAAVGKRRLASTGRTARNPERAHR